MASSSEPQGCSKSMKWVEYKFAGDCGEWKLSRNDDCCEAGEPLTQTEGNTRSDIGFAFTRNIETHLFFKI